MTVALERPPKAFATGEDVERLTRAGERYELIFGELVPMSPVGNEQGVATIDLSSEAHGFVRRNKLGRGFAAETGFRYLETPKRFWLPTGRSFARSGSKARPRKASVTSSRTWCWKRDLQTTRKGRSPERSVSGSASA